MGACSRSSCRRPPDRLSGATPRAGFEVRLPPVPSNDDRPTGLARPDRAALARVHDARERAIAALSEGFANDALDVDEFERRVTLAHTSDSPEEIAALTADLAASTTALAPATVALAPATADDGVG